MKTCISNQRTVNSIVFLILYLLFFSCNTMKKAPNVLSPSWYNFNVVPSADKRQFIVMKDSSIVYGKKVTGGWGWSGKQSAEIDGRKIPGSEYIGMQNKEGYWLKLEDNNSAIRLIHGRISVYRTLPDQVGARAVYFQKENGPFRMFDSMEGLKRMLRDCQKAYDMLNISDDEYNKIVRKQHDYLHTVIEAYNNCGEWK